jgi:hypothetical protein
VEDVGNARGENKREARKDSVCKLRPDGVDKDIHASQPHVGDGCREGGAVVIDEGQHLRGWSRL